MDSFTIINIISYITTNTFNIQISIKYIISNINTIMHKINIPTNKIIYPISIIIESRSINHTFSIFTIIYSTIILNIISKYWISNIYFRVIPYCNSIIISCNIITIKYYFINITTWRFIIHYSTSIRISNIKCNTIHIKTSTTSNINTSIHNQVFNSNIGILWNDK